MVVYATIGLRRSLVSTAPTFEERIAERFGQMSPAEQRVVRFFQGNREEVLIASAAALA